MKRPRPKLSKRWLRFVSGYPKDLAYWYQPKGLAVSVEAVYDRLLPLEKLEGSRPWQECQADYVLRLNELGVSSAKGRPLARMLKQVMGSLGLAWVDRRDLVEITPVGKLFLEAGAGERKRILALQSRRYQFWNPAVGSNSQQAVQLHPVPFLTRLLQSLDGEVSNTEYALFIAKAKAIDEVDTILDQIEAFRDLDSEAQSELVYRLDAYQIGGAKRGSLLNTIRLNRSYAMRMWELSGLFDEEFNQGIRLKKGIVRGEVRSWLEDYATNGTYIDFASEKAFFAWMGSPNAKPDRRTALDIYTDRGDVDAATSAKRGLGASNAEVINFRKMLLSEKVLEDTIEANFDAFAKSLGRSMELVSRQYDTTVGPIDLLAKDKKTGGYIVIELKKGRAADKVFGQLSRYMGWVRKNLAGKAPVSGMIVGTEMDEKLRSARDAHDTEIELVVYSSKMSFRAEKSD